MNDTSIFTNRMTNVPLDHKPALNITAEVSNDNTSNLKDNLQTAIEQSEIFGDFEVSESILSGTVCDSSSKLSEKQEGSKEFVKMANLKSNSSNILSNLSSENSDILKKGNENIKSNYDSTTGGITQDIVSKDKFIQEEKNSDSRVEDLQALQENNFNDKTLQQASVLTQKEKLNGIHYGKESTSTNEDKMEIQTSDSHTSLLQEDNSSIPRKQTSQFSASEVLEENFCIKRFEKASVPTPQGSKEDSASNDSVSISSIESTDNCIADGSNSSQEDKNIKENLSCQDDVDSPVNDTEEEMKEHAQLEEKINSGVQDQVVSSSEFLPARFSALQESDMESDSIVSINNEDLVPQYNKADDNSNSESSVTESETENISIESSSSSNSSSSSSTGVSDSENTESSREKSSISDFDERTDAVQTNNTNDNHKDDIKDKLLSLEKQDENLELKKNTSDLKEKCDDNVIEDDIHQIMNQESKNEQRLIAQDVNYNSEPCMAEPEKDQDMKSVSSASNSDCDMFEDNDEVMKNITDDELTKSMTDDQLMINKADEIATPEIDNQRLHRSEVSPGENLLPSHESQISIKVNKENIDSLILSEGSKNIEDLQTINEPYQSASNESREDESNNPQSSSSVKSEKSNDSNIKFADVLSCNGIKANNDEKNITESLTSSTESVSQVTETENSEIFVKLDDIKCTSDQVCHKRNRNDMNAVLDLNEGKSSEEYTESKNHSNESVAESDLSKTSKKVQEKVPNKCDKIRETTTCLKNSKSLSENLSSQTVKYCLKACEVNLSDSKISESVILNASRDLLLGKPNFCKLKRKLEDMLQNVQLEEEKAAQQIKKMREEKSIILKDIVFQIKNVKKKYNI